MAWSGPQSEARAVPPGFEQIGEVGRPHLAGLAAGQGEAGLGQVGEIVNRPQTRPVYVGEGMCAVQIEEGAAIDGELAAVRTEHTSRDPGQPGNPAKDRMFKTRPVKVVPAPGRDRAPFV